MYKAQKIGVVDTRYILEKYPQYKEAEKDWKLRYKLGKQKLAKCKPITKLKALFENEKVLLVGEQLKSREKEVLDLEKELKGLFLKDLEQMERLIN